DRPDHHGGGRGVLPDLQRPESRGVEPQGKGLRQPSRGVVSALDTVGGGLAAHAEAPRSWRLRVAGCAIRSGRCGVRTVRSAHGPDPPAGAGGSVLAPLAASAKERLMRSRSIRLNRITAYVPEDEGNP